MDKFTITEKGYSVQEVNSFIENVIGQTQAMLNKMKIQQKEIEQQRKEIEQSKKENEQYKREIEQHKKEIEQQRREFDQRQKETEKKSEKQSNETIELEKEIERQRKEIDNYKKIEQDLKSALFKAEQSSTEIKKQAYDEKNVIIEDARRNASRIVNDALLRAEKIELKSDTLERNMRIFKKKLKLVVEQQLTVIDEIEELELK